MTDLELDSKAILNGLVKLDQNGELPANAATGLGGGAKAGSKGGRAAAAAAATSEALGSADARALMAHATSGNRATSSHFSGSGTHAVATLRVETSAVLKELARFRACDDQTMSCFYCREWAQWVYRKQISALSGAITTGASGNSTGKGKKKGKSSGNNAATMAGNDSMGSASAEEILERERLERKRAMRLCYSSIGELCDSLRELVAEERQALPSIEQVGGMASAPASRPGSPSLSVSSATSSTFAEQAGRSAGGKGAKARGGSKAKAANAAAAAAPASTAPPATDESAASSGNSALIDTIVERAMTWYEGYQFPLADVYEDMTFDFPPDSFPYDERQDPLDPALLLPALQVTKTYISLPAAKFPLLGNITSEQIATHSYPTCQHTKADHPTPSELDTQRLIFNSQLQKWRLENKSGFEREMEPVWQITQLLLKSAQRIEAMRVRLFARGCRANREQFLQSIRTRAQPFSEFWARVSEPYRTGKAALVVVGDGDGDSVSGDDDNEPARKSRGRRSTRTKTNEQLAEELDSLVAKHLDGLLEVSSQWSRTFLESYYGVAREFARELETILGECITMCDRRAQGLNYPPPLTLQPQLEKARAAIACLQPHLDARIEKIQAVIRDRNAEIFNQTTSIREDWAESSGSTVATKLAKAAHKDFRKKMRRVEFQQQSGVITWAMRELEQLLTAPDVATVVTDCLELLMTEAEILERAVSQVFARKYESASNDLREQRQDIVDDFTEGLLTGREELAGIIGKLLLKEAWRILEANISLQRQKALLDGGSGGGSGSSGKNKKSKGSQAKHSLPPTPSTPDAATAAASRLAQPLPPTTSVQPVQPPTPVDVQSQADSTSVLDVDDFDDDEEDSAAKKRRKNKKKKAKKKKAKQQQQAAATAAAQATQTNAGDEDDDEDDDEENEDRTVRGGDPQNPFASLSMANANGEVDSDAAGEAKRVETPVVSMTASPAAAAAAPVPERVASVKEEEVIKREAGSGPGLSSVPVTAQPVAQTPAQQQTRPRRGTNAARYVPGVGFISDDGISATSPRPSPGVTATFKGPVNGISSASSSAVAAAAATSPAGRVTPGALSVQTAVSAAGKQQSSVLTASPGVSETPQLPQHQPSRLDKESLLELQSVLSGKSVEAMQQELESLAHEDLVLVATTAMVSRNGLMNLTNKWHASVSNVLQAYETIASQVESFRRLCDSHDEETARLSSLLAQAAQEAQQWHEKYDVVCAELKELKASYSNASADASAKKEEKAASEELTPGGDVSSMAPVTPSAAAAPPGPQTVQSMVMPSPGDGGMLWSDQQQQQPQQQQQQQAWPSFGGAQYPAAAAAANTSGAMPAGFMSAQTLLPGLLAAGQLHGNMDYATLMSVANRMHAAAAYVQQIQQNQQSQPTQQGFVGGGANAAGGFNMGSLLGNSSGFGMGMSQAPPLQQQQQMQQAPNAASSVSSSSLLSALNAGSQPF